MKVLYGGGFDSVGVALYAPIIQSRIMIVLHNLLTGCQEQKIKTNKEIKVS